MHWHFCYTFSISLVESIPDNLTYSAGSPSHSSTFDTWMTLIRSSKKTIDIASFYWSLRGSDVWRDPSDWQVCLVTVWHWCLIWPLRYNLNLGLTTDPSAHLHDWLITGQVTYRLSHWMAFRAMTSSSTLVYPLPFASLAILSQLYHASLICAI